MTPDFYVLRSRTGTPREMFYEIRVDQGCKGTSPDDWTVLTEWGRRGGSSWRHHIPYVGPVPAPFIAALLRRLARRGYTIEFQK